MKNFTLLPFIKKLISCCCLLVLLVATKAQVPVVSGGFGQTNADPNNAANGGPATGLGCGGGGANYYGGNGGDGMLGGGGGGASGFVASNMIGGKGGDGVVVISSYNGALYLNTIVYKTGSSITIDPSVTDVKVWVIGAGGGGAGSTNNDGTVGGGGGAGGIAFVTASVNPGDIITYTVGTGGAGGIDIDNGADGGNTTATVAGISITGFGGTGGWFNNSLDAAGGSFSGGDGGAAGGDGKGSDGDTGGGGGGGIGSSIGGTPQGGDGATGADANDVSGLFTALSSGSILPVSWKSFIASNQKDAVLLQWQTGFELNALNFTVQYSTNGIHYINISVVAAANSATGYSYQYIHHGPSQGTGYYRLYQTDINGKNSFSSIVRTTITNAGEKDFVLNGSNIINGAVKFQLNKNTTISLLDFEGRLVYKNYMNKGANQINVTGLSKGYYILRTINDSQKILIQ